MDFELILNAVQCKYTEAKAQFDAGHIPACHEQLDALLDLLLEELVGSAPLPSAPEAKKWNPEQALNDIAIAIRYRTISTIHRWNIVYYHERITCVPTYVTVPQQIILHEFTEKMIHQGFTVIYWNQLKQNLITFYKELHE